MMRMAIHYVRDPAIAEDVVQETWLGFLKSLERFESRCSIKTWLFRILFNKAQSRAAREKRQVPFSVLATSEDSAPWNAVDAACFRGLEDEGVTGHWVANPPRWKTDPERALIAEEALTLVRTAIDELPAAQAAVVRMRDVEGLSSGEVCAVLGISAANQRVLLHRARTKLRKALAERFEVDDSD